MTVYVVPETGGGSPPGSGTELDPYNGLGNVPTALPNGEVLLLRDGLYLGERYLPTADYASGAGLTIRAERKWGAILDGNNAIQQAVRWTSLRRIHIDGLRVRNYTGVGIRGLINATRGLDECSVRNVWAHNNGSHGIELGKVQQSQDGSGSRWSGGIVEDCIAEDNDDHGISAFNAADDGVIRRCISRNNGLGGGSFWGLYISPDAINLATVSQTWVEGPANVWAADLNSTGFGAKVVEGVVVDGRTTAGVYHFTNAGATATPALGEFGQVGATLYIGLDQTANGRSIVAVFASTTGVVIEDSYATGQAGVDGVGLGLDRRVQNGIVRRNLVELNNGPGISCNSAESPLVESNISVNNGQVTVTAEGIRANTPVGTARFYHNTTAGNPNGGYRVVRLATGETITLRNLIATEATSLVTDRIDGTIDEDYCNGATWSGPNSFPDDPQLQLPSYSPAVGSPVAGAGDATVPTTQDRYQRAF